MNSLGQKISAPTREPMEVDKRFRNHVIPKGLTSYKVYKETSKHNKRQKPLVFK